MSLEYGILGFLTNRELTGYELKKAFDISCAFIWPANQGQIYRTLESMLKREWVEICQTSPGLRHDKKTYCITENGRRVLQEWLSSEIEESPMRNEALLKLFHLAKSDPRTALKNLDRMIEKKKQIAVVFDKMTVLNAAEYCNILGLSEDSPDYRLNLFLSKWGYMREKVFLSFLEQYRAELLHIQEEGKKCAD